jgi:hypothetical protein
MERSEKTGVTVMVVLKQQIGVKITDTLGETVF